MCAQSGAVLNDWNRLEVWGRYARHLDLFRAQPSVFQIVIWYNSAFSYVVTVATHRCSKTMKRWPCWWSKQILWKWNYNCLCKRVLLLKKISIDKSIFTLVVGSKFLGTKRYFIYYKWKFWSPQDYLQLVHKRSDSLVQQYGLLDEMWKRYTGTRSTFARVPLERQRKQILEYW